MFTKCSKNIRMYIILAISLGGVKVTKFMIYQIFSNDKTEDGVINSTTKVRENLNVFVNKNRLKETG